VLASGVVADFDATELLARAARGDTAAWAELVGRYCELVWTVARAFRLSAADAADVSQATWLRLVEHLGDIRQGDRLGAWLVTTARREALGLIRRSGRDLPVEDTDTVWSGSVDEVGPEQTILRRERDASLWQAFRGLPGACQRLLQILMAEPTPTYAEVSAALEIPVGSIGPTRARCLASLRTLMSGSTAR